jgi:hypothetical protein
MDFNHVTTEEAVATYNATHNIFTGLIREVRELSRKKPDATLSQGKVKMINRVLADLRNVLEKEPEYKFLDLLDDEELPQTSDAVLVMVQFESALESFSKHYHRRAKKGYDTRYVWVTNQLTLEEGEILE